MFYHFSPLFLKSQTSIFFCKIKDNVIYINLFKEIELIKIKSNSTTRLWISKSRLDPSFNKIKNKKYTQRHTISIQCFFSIQNTTPIVIYNKFTVHCLCLPISIKANNCGHRWMHRNEHANA